MYQQQAGYANEYHGNQSNERYYYEQQQYNSQPYPQQHQQQVYYSSNHQTLDPNAAAYYPSPHSQQAPAYYNNNNYNGYEGGRGRGRGRGGRGGRGRRGGGHQFNFQHEYDEYSNGPPSTVQSETLASMGENVTEAKTDARPKNRSYQDNRYRENRSKRSRPHVLQPERKHDWRDNVGPEQAVPMNSNFPESKDEPDFSSAAKSNSGEGSLPIKEKPKRVRTRNREKYENSKAVADTVIKLQVTSEPAPLPKEHRETKREMKERLEKNCEKKESAKEPDDANMREQREQRGGGGGGGSSSTRGGRGGKGRFVKGKRRDDQDQRECLEEQLWRADYECSVCCDVVRRADRVWSCQQCYTVFHLRCIKRWAHNPSSAAGEKNVSAGAEAGAGAGGKYGWRCPGCQNVTHQFPAHYRCFCGKVLEPEYSRMETPHSCGELCGKKRGGGCNHSCNILCHPGPCPTCQATVTQSCNCTSIKVKITCMQAASGVQCSQACRKHRNCGRHECEKLCHAGSCQPCQETVHQECFCGSEKRDVICGTAESFTTSFSCDNICDRLLECGKHECPRACHPGPCSPCATLPGVVTHCPCGTHALSELTAPEREVCTDPVPTCNDTCNKPLKCGPKGTPHRCQSPCHECACRECPNGRTDVTCRCGEFTKDVPCAEAMLFTEEKPFVCERRCSKKRDCGRHRCTVLCCTETEHRCAQLCGQKLKCGLHRCEELCHRGACPPCWQAGFDELACRCGAEVLLPPIPCGTRPPECRQPCQREHTCMHPPLHTCHSEDTCPLCTRLTEKWCMGQHELRKNIPCHLADISCGLPCSKPLPCQMHKCQLTCHKGPCVSEGDVCKQPCVMTRSECEHPCRAPCHADKPQCPDTTCKAPVLLKCDCGRRAEKAPCLAGGTKAAEDYQRLATTMMALTMASGGGADSGMDISALTKANASSKLKPRKLECDKECAVTERNKRLALALEIKNPDISGKLSGNPSYSDFLKSFASKNPSAVFSMETALRALVETAQHSKAGGRASRSHAFPSMASVSRRAVHELAESYGCTTESYDAEPNKNVVATATKNKCWLPTVTLTALIQKRVPAPIPLYKKEDDIRSENAIGATSSVCAWGKKIPPSSSSSNPPASSNPPTGYSDTSAVPLVRSSGCGGSSTSASGHPLRSRLTTLTKVSSTAASTAETSSSSKAPVIDYFDMTD